MSFSEVAVAIGLLTPLVLGILAFIEKWRNAKKKDVEPADGQTIVQGMTVPVDYAADLITELRRDRTVAERERDEAIKRAERLQIQLDTLRMLDERR